MKETMARVRKYGINSKLFQASFEARLAIRSTTTETRQNPSTTHLSFSKSKVVRDPDVIVIGW